MGREGWVGWLTDWERGPDPEPVSSLIVHSSPPTTVLLPLSCSAGCRPEVEGPGRPARASMSLPQGQWAGRASRGLG